MNKFMSDKTIRSSKLYQLLLHHFLLSDFCDKNTNFNVGPSEELDSEKPLGETTQNMKLMFEYVVPINDTQAESTRFIGADDKGLDNHLDVDALFEFLVSGAEDSVVNWDDVEDVRNKLFNCLGATAFHFVEAIVEEPFVEKHTHHGLDGEFVAACLCMAFNNPAAIWIELRMPKPHEGEEGLQYCYIKGVRPRHAH